MATRTATARCTDVCCKVKHSWNQSNMQCEWRSRWVVDCCVCNIVSKCKSTETPFDASEAAWAEEEIDTALTSESQISLASFLVSLLFKNLAKTSQCIFLLNDLILILIIISISTDYLLLTINQMLMFFVQVFVLILQPAFAEPNFRVSKCVSTIVRWEWAPLERIIYSSGTKSKGAQKQRCWIGLIRTSNRLLVEFETKTTKYMLECQLSIVFQFMSRDT